MKTSQIARGIVGALSLAGVIGAVGCSADAGYEGAAGDGEIGSAEQAIAIAGLDAHTNSSSTVVGLHSPAYLRTGTNDLVIAGGIDNSGNKLATVDKYTYDGVNDSWTNLTNGALSSVRYQSQMAAIPGVANKFAIVGGRDNADNSVATIDVIDVSGTGSLVVTKAMSVKRGEQFSVVPCGTGSKLLIIGGQDENGNSLATLEVFTYDAATPANSAVATLKNSGGTTVTLAAARHDFQAISLSNTDVLVPGGFDGTNFLSSTERINLTAACALNSNNTTPTASGNLPASRRLFAAAKVGITVDPDGAGVGLPSATYSAMIATGEAAAAPTLPLTPFVFDATNNVWHSATVLDLTVGRQRAMFATDGTDFAVVGGKDLTNTGLLASRATKTAVDKFNNAGAGSWTSSTLTTSRVRGAAAFIGGTIIAAVGQSNPAGTQTILSSVE